MSNGFTFPLPWRIADHDGRISILSDDGARVTEIYPGQHLGIIPPRDVIRAVAEKIVAAVNRPSIDDLLAAPITPEMVRAWRKAYIVRGEANAPDDEQAAADLRAMLRAFLKPED
jgi:hypothetical protein